MATRTADTERDSRSSIDDIALEKREHNDNTVADPEYVAKLKAAHTRVDRRLVLWYAFTYIIMRIDLSNISNSAIMNLETNDGIKQTLGGLTGDQWSWVISIFYYPYLFAEPFSTVALKRFSPRIWMSRIMVTWGIITMCQAAAKNYGGILAVRFFLGLAEAGFYPCVLYHLSFWYAPDKLTMRISFFFACGMFSGTIAGLLAYGISFMNGIAGLKGWRWLFILEGIPAVLAGVITFFILPNYPETTEWLNEEEKKVILSDLGDNAPSMKGETFSMAQIKVLIKDRSFIPFTVVWVLTGVGSWGISFVLPSVIYALGISNTAYSQLMTMPPYTLVGVILLTLAFCIHRKWISVWIAVLGVLVIQIICYILLITVHNAVARYIFVMIATAASQCFFPLMWPERIRAAKGTSAAAIAIGFTNGMVQLLGILGPQIYNTKFGPSYRTSYCTSIGLLCGSVVTFLWTWWSVNRNDKERAAAADGDIEAPTKEQA